MAARVSEIKTSGDAKDHVHTSRLKDFVVHCSILDPSHVGWRLPEPKSTRRCQLATEVNFL